MRDFDEYTDDTDMQSEMEALQPYISPTAPKEDIIRQLETCPICGNQLQFTYFADFINLSTHEVVRCNDCNYRARKGLQSLL